MASLRSLKEDFLTSVLTDSLTGLGQAFVQAAKREAPVSSSVLRESIVYKRTGLRRGELRMVDYAEIVEEGSLAHNIPNAFGRGLLFGTHGNFTPGMPGRRMAAPVNKENPGEKGYFHPGTHPNDFLGRAWDSLTPEDIAR